MKSKILVMVMLFISLLLVSCSSNEGHVHSYSLTWYSDENNHWVECSCGEKDRVLEHDFDEGVVIEEATTTKQGLKICTCETCEFEKEFVIPRIGEPDKSIESVDKVSSNGLVDTFKIKFTDGTTANFTVTYNEKGVESFSGDIKYAYVDKSNHLWIFLDNDIIHDVGFIDISIDTTLLLVKFVDKNNQVFKVENVKIGEKVTRPSDFILEGNKITAWYLDGVIFDFDTKIEEDITLVAEYEALNVTSLAGSFIIDNGNLTAKMDNSFGVLNDVSVKTGEMEVSFKGEGDKTIYFSTIVESLKRGKPTGDYYALSLDSYGNVKLLENTSGQEVIRATSMCIKDIWNKYNTYTFVIKIENKKVTVKYKDETILSFTDNIPMIGCSVIVGCETKESSIDVVSYSTNNYSIIYDETIYWTDNSKQGVYDVYVSENKVSTVNGYNFDLNTLKLKQGEYLVKVCNTSGVELCSYEFATLNETYDLSVYHGDFKEDCNGYYVSTKKNSLALLNDVEFINGTITAKIIPGIYKDNGIVFRASDGGLNSFWEDSPAQYYTITFIENGAVMLGKVNYNQVPWTALGSYKISDFDSLKEYEFKVTLAGGYIGIYIDGNKIIEYDDTDPFMHSGVGFRTGLEGSKVGSFKFDKPNAVGFGAEANNQAVALNGAIDPSQISAFIEYDNGMKDILEVTQDMIGHIDTTTSGYKTVTITYLDGDTTLTDDVTIIVDENYVYHMSFPSGEYSGSLPIGWSIQSTSQNGTTAQIKDGYLQLHNPTGNPSAIIYDSDLNDYSVEIEFSVSWAQNNSRWIGITARNNNNSWWKGSLGLNGSLAINAITNGNLQAPNWLQGLTDSISLKIWGSSGIDTALRVKMRVSVRENTIAINTNGKTCVYTLPSGWEEGSFGIAFSHGTFNIYSISVSRPSDDDFKSN